MLVRRLSLFVGGLLLVVFGFILGTSLISNTFANYTAVTLQQSPNAQTPLLDQERFFADIYNRVSPSVVSINVTGTENRFGLFEASGSGFVVDKQGYIVTNNHVVDSADLIEVNFLDGTIVRGKVVGLDPDADIAVLKIDLPSEKLIPLTFADSDKLFVGQSVLALGGPFGQRWTLTSGIVSALGRTIQGLTQFSVGSVIQTDAAINPGNSGGPLLNLNGEVIGINTQIVSETRSNSGIGFAVPSNLVKRVAEELITAGHVDYSYLGISAVTNQDNREMTLMLMETLKLPNNMRGVVVDSVAPGGPAHSAGLRGASNPIEVEGQLVPQSADIITAVDGIELHGMSDLVSYLASNTRPGQIVNLTVWRDGQTLSLAVTLGSRR